MLQKKLKEPNPLYVKKMFINGFYCSFLLLKGTYSYFQGGTSRKLASKRSKRPVKCLVKHVMMSGTRHTRYPHWQVSLCQIFVKATIPNVVEESKQGMQTVIGSLADPRPRDSFSKCHTIGDFARKKNLL